MHIDLTRHGGYQLCYSDTMKIIVAVMFFGGFIVAGLLCKVASRRYRARGEVHDGLFVFMSYVIRTYVVIFTFLFGLLWLTRSMPVYEGINTYKSTPFHTNFMQKSRAVPATTISYIDTNNTERGSEYYEKMKNSLEEHYKVKIVNMDLSNVYFDVRPFSYYGNVTDGSDVVVELQSSKKIVGCNVKITNVKNVSKKISSQFTWVKSFDVYLLCNNGEPDKR